MSNPQSPWRRWIPSGAFYALLLAQVGFSADPRPRVLSFASENWLTMAIGTYEPARGWVPSAEAFTMSAPGELYSLFGITGKLGEVRGREEHRPDPAWTPIEWHARIERGATMRQPCALAILGSWPEENAPAREISLEDPILRHAVSTFLKKHGLNVAAPLITQAYQVDFNGDGLLDTVVCAHSDLHALKDDGAAAIYAVALVVSGPADHEKIIRLAAQTSYKSASESMEDHQHHYGTRDFYRILAIHDIDGDGRPEIALYRAKSDATQVDIFTFQKHHKRKVLSVYKANYN